MTGRAFLFVSQTTGLQNDFVLNPRRRLHDFSNIRPYGVMVSGFQSADVQHHIQYPGSARDRLDRFSNFGVRRMPTQGKPDRDSKPNIRTRDRRGCLINVTRRDKYDGKPVGLRLLAEPKDIVLRCLRPQDGMVDQCRKIPT